MLAIIRPKAIKFLTTAAMTWAIIKDLYDTAKLLVEVNPAERQMRL